MAELPNSLEAAIEQSKAATRSALADGLQRLQVEFLLPELKVMPVAQQFIPVLEDLGMQFKVYFPDAGAAALARRDWGNPSYSIRGIGEFKGEMEPEDELFLIVEPSAVEVNEVEKMCDAAGDRPFILLNPKLEDVSIIGIGYAGRQLRERFLGTLETCYCLRPLEGAAVLRCYPDPWQVWLEKAPGQYELIGEETQRPVGEVLDQILMQATGGMAAESTGTGSSQSAVRPRRGFLAELQQFFRALNQ